MTVSTLTNSVVYRGNGAATQFAVPFKVLSLSHLRVRRRVYTTGGYEYTYVGLDYSYTGLGASSGTLTLAGTALSSTYELVIERIVPYTQELDIVNAGGFYPDTVEAQLDLMAMGTQQLADLVGRAAVVPVGETGITLAAASTRGSKILGFFADGTARYFTTAELSTAAGPPGTVTAASEVIVTPGALDGGGNLAQALLTAAGPAGQINSSGGNDGIRSMWGRSTLKFTNGGAGANETYWNNVLYGLSHNLLPNGTRIDAAQAASMIKLEAKFWQSGAYVAEPIIAIIDTGGTERRLLYSLMPHNFADRAVSRFQIQSDNITLAAWDGTEMATLTYTAGTSTGAFNWQANTAMNFNKAAGTSPMKQINAAGAAFINLPYIDASNRIAHDVDAYFAVGQVFSGNGGALLKFDGAANRYQIGLQPNGSGGLYARTFPGGRFSVYADGTHHDTAGNAGAGGTEIFAVEDNGLYINATKVLGTQGAAVADATDAASTMARLNDLLARLRAHGIIAT